MANGGAHEFRQQQVGPVCDANTHGFVNTRSRIEYDKAVRRWPKYAIKCRRSILKPAGKAPRPSGIRHGSCESKMKAVRRRYRALMAEFG